MAATIKDIVRETGLSFATISKYLNDGVLRQKDRAAIEIAIKSLTYARNFKSNRSRTVGVVIPELSNLVCDPDYLRCGRGAPGTGLQSRHLYCRTDEERESHALPSGQMCGRDHQYACVQQRTPPASRGRTENPILLPNQPRASYWSVFPAIGQRPP